MILGLSQLGPHHCSRTQNSKCWDHLEKRMIPIRAVIWGALTLTAIMSRCGGEDIVGEFTAELCGDKSWETESEGKQVEIGIEIVEIPHRLSQY